MERNFVGSLLEKKEEEKRQKGVEYGRNKTQGADMRPLEEGRSGQLCEKMRMEFWASEERV